VGVRELVHPEGLEDAADFKARVAWMFEPPVRSKFGAIRLDQLDDPSNQLEWLMDGWLTMGDKSIVAGPSRSGKSFLAIHISMCCAFNLPVFGIGIRHGGVIYQAGEGALGVKKRLKAWRQHHGLQFDASNPFVLLQRPIDIYRDTEKVKDLIDEINAHAATFDVPLRLVVIDTLAKATAGADEISGRDMSIVLDNVDQIQQKTGAHVMLVHHMNAGGQKVRGHSSIYANVDQVLLVTRDENTKIRTVVLDKAKDDVEGSRFQFDLPQCVIGIDNNGRQITSCVCTAVGDREKIVREEALKGVRLSALAEGFMRAFFEAEKRYGFPVPFSMTMAMQVRSLVYWEDVKRAFAEINPNDTIAPAGETSAEALAEDGKWRDRMRKRIEKARLDLTSLGVIGITQHEGKTVVYHTGKALRAFDFTWKNREEGKDDKDPSLDIEF
jgi:hypothetical protein